MTERPFIKVHDDIEGHPKMAPLSDGAFRLIVTSWGWCHRYDTDGKMPAAVWARRGTAKARRELLGAALALLSGDEVLFHDYLQHQQSAEQRQARKQQARSAGQAGGLAKGKRTAKQTASETLSGTASENVAEVEVEVEVEKNTCSTDVEPAPDTFEEFWTTYPRRVGKGQALKAWARVVKNHDPEQITAGALRLAQQPGREEKFTPHPATWLNGLRWLDEPSRFEAPREVIDPRQTRLRGVRL